MVPDSQAQPHEAGSQQTNLFFAMRQEFLQLMILARCRYVSSTVLQTKLLSLTTLPSFKVICPQAIWNLVGFPIHLGI